MDISYIRNRITDLRLKKGISEYKMSLDLGHSKNYIRGISSGRTLPSLPELLYICDYLGITAKDFFDDGTTEPVLVQEIVRRANHLERDDLLALIAVMERIKPMDGH